MFDQPYQFPQKLPEGYNNAIPSGFKVKYSCKYSLLKKKLQLNGDFDYLTLKDIHLVTV